MIAQLPFSPRCTAFGHGYICIGGSNAQFAKIKLNSATSLDVDPPIDIWEPTRRPLEIRLDTIGDNDINSVVIHRISDDVEHLSDIVAVITGNDKSVRIISLLHVGEVIVLDFPDMMNHATLSPDSRLLTAVGDLDTLYVFRRIMNQELPTVCTFANRRHLGATDWKQVAKFPLYIPANELPKGYFSTAWSSSGRTFAVGSEAGYISIFDMTEIISNADDDLDFSCAYRMTIPSSRPSDDEIQAKPGAVRVLLFTPDPWDMLIWAEDQGRICIVDLRMNAIIRETIDLNPEDANLEKVITEVENPMTTDLDELTARAVLNRHQADLAWPPLPSGLTDDERRILQSLRTARQYNQRSTGETTSSPPRPRTRNREDGYQDELTMSMAEPSNFEDTTSSSLDQTWNRPIWASANSAGRPGLPPLSSIINRNSTTSTTIPPHARLSSNNPQISNDLEEEYSWQAITNAMNLARGPLFEGASLSTPRNDESEVHARLRSTIDWQAVTRQRDRLRAGQGRNSTMTSRMNHNNDRPFFETSWDALRRQHASWLMPEYAIPKGTEIGVRLTGLAMDKEGRTLWVGSEEGIFEIKLALKNRLQWPAVEFR